MMRMETGCNAPSGIGLVAEVKTKKCNFFIYSVVLDSYQERRDRMKISDWLDEKEAEGVDVSQIVVPKKIDLR